MPLPAIFFKLPCSVHGSATLEKRPPIRFPVRGCGCRRSTKCEGQPKSRTESRDAPGEVPEAAKIAIGVSGDDAVKRRIESTHVFDAHTTAHSYRLRHDS